MNATLPNKKHVTSEHQIPWCKADFVQNGSFFAIVNSMVSLKHNQNILNPISSVWLLLCACFMLASVAMPVYSAQKILPIISLSNNSQAGDMKTPGALHHGMTNQQHHAGNGSISPCDGPGCDSMSDCADSCTMNTCCSSPSVSDAFSNLTLTDYRDNTIHRLTDGSSVLSRRTEPLFRPPIR